MVGVKRKDGEGVQISAVIYSEHAKLIERILQKEYTRPVAHNSASEVIRRAIEVYAEFLGLKEVSNGV
jgi:hypothetical protein